MIKNSYDITVGDLARTEKTGEIKHYRKWYNVIPSRFFVKKISQTLNEIYQQLNDGKTEEFEIMQRIEEKKYILKKTIEIQELQALDLIITNHLLNYTRLLSLKRLFKTRRLRKVKDNDEVLRKAIEDVKQLIGLKIKTTDDILKLRAKISEKKERLQNFLDTISGGDEGKKVNIISLVFQYLAYLNLSYEPERLKVNHFFDLMEMANEKAQKEKEHIDKLKSNGRD